MPSKSKVGIFESHLVVKICAFQFKWHFLIFYLPVAWQLILLLTE